MTEESKKKLLKFQAMCSRREYCCRDIREKLLKSLDGNADEADEVLESLKADRFVDDLRYASAFARDKASLSGWGPVKIRFALAAKGIGRSIIDDALKEIDTDKSSDRMEQVLRQKWKTLEGDPQARLKLIKFALTRGYEYNDVRKSVDRISSCRED